MTKTKEELNQLKKEYETMINRLKELSDDELNIVTGGNDTLIISRHNIRNPLAIGLNLNLNDYNYHYQESSISVDPPDREYNKDKRSLLFKGK